MLYRTASLVSRIRYARSPAVLLSVLRHAFATDEFVYDFAVVVFGVHRLFYSFFFFIRGLLHRALRTYTHVINLLYHNDRALLSEDARRLCIIATCTPARWNTSLQITIVLPFRHDFIYVSRLQPTVVVDRTITLDHASRMMIDDPACTYYIYAGCSIQTRLSLT